MPCSAGSGTRRPLSEGNPRGVASETRGTKPDSNTDGFRAEAGSRGSRAEAGSRRSDGSLDGAATDTSRQQSEGSPRGFPLRLRLRRQKPEAAPRGRAEGDMRREEMESLLDEIREMRLREVQSLLDQIRDPRPGPSEIIRLVREATGPNLDRERLRRIEADIRALYGSDG